MMMFHVYIVVLNKVIDWLIDWLIDWSIGWNYYYSLFPYTHFFFLKNKQNSKWAAHMKTGDSNDMFQKE